MKTTFFFKIRMIFKIESTESIYYILQGIQDLKAYLINKYIMTLCENFSCKGIMESSVENCSQKPLKQKNHSSKPQKVVQFSKESKKTL